MRTLGAGREAIVPFKSYLKASISLDAPSSVCKAVYNGKYLVERVDKLIQNMGLSINSSSPEIDRIVENMDNSIKKFSNSANENN